LFYFSKILFYILKQLRTPLIVFFLGFMLIMLGLTLTPGYNPNTNEIHHLSFFDSFFIITYTSTTIGYGEIPYPFTTQQKMYLAISIYIIVFLWFYLLSSFADIFKQKKFHILLQKNKISKFVFKKDLVVLFLKPEVIEEILKDPKLKSINFILIQTRSNNLEDIFLTDNSIILDIYNQPFNISTIFDYEPNINYFFYDESIKYSVELLNIIKIKYKKLNILNINHGHSEEHFSLIDTLNNNFDKPIIFEDIFRDRMSCIKNNIFKTLFLDYLIGKKERTFSIIKKLFSSLDNYFTFTYVNSILTHTEINKNNIYILDCDNELDNLKNIISIKNKLEEGSYLILTNLNKNRASHFVDITHPYIYFFNNLDILTDIIYSRTLLPDIKKEIILDIEKNSISILTILSSFITFNNPYFITYSINKQTTPNMFKNSYKLKYKDIFFNKSLVVSIKDINGTFKSLEDNISIFDNICIVIERENLNVIEYLFKNPNYSIHSEDDLLNFKKEVK